MRPTDLAVLEKSDRISPNVVERINEFDVKIGIDRGVKTMAAWKKQQRNGDEECSSVESKSYREMFDFRSSKTRI